MQGYNQAKVFVIQWTHHVAIQESDKSSHLTGRTLCVSKKRLYPICDVGHIFLDKMVGNQDDCLTFELQSLPGVSKIAIGVGTLLSLASEVPTSFWGISFGKMSAGLMDGLRRQNIPRSFFSLAAVSTFTP
jgi:hypothetical protein